MEEKMKKICEGTVTRNDVVHECIEQYRDMFIRANLQTDVLKSVSVPPPLGSLAILYECSYRDQKARQYMIG
jgi:hypothetical protein